jgi:hypothetical protein
MKPSEVKKLKLAATIWVWVVRFGRGRWWPGTVERIDIKNGLPLVKVRFDSFSLKQHRTDPPISVGFITTPMRRLELRDISVEGSARPRFVPTSCLREPEKLAPTRGLRTVDISGESVSANGSSDNSLHESPYEGDTMSAPEVKS